jgi:hypothetical protein
MPTFGRPATAPDKNGTAFHRAMTCERFVSLLTGSPLVGPKPW